MKRIYYLFFGVALVYTFATNLWFYNLLNCNNPGRVMAPLAISSGDTFSYLGSIDNFINEGSYYFKNLQGEKSYAGRMPYYGLPYYLFRQVTSQKNAYTLLALIQILLQALSVFFLIKLVARFSQNKWVLWGTFLGYLICSYISTWNLYLAPESLSVSFMIFFLYHYQKYIIDRKEKTLFIASVFLAFLVVLKPYFSLLYLPIGIGFILRYKKVGLIIRKTIITSIALLLLLTPWVIRNYLVLNKFIPFQENVYAGYNYSRSDLACRSFINAWGGSVVFWDPNEAGCYFTKTKIKCKFKLPDYAIASSYTRQDVEDVRQLYFKLQDQPNDSLDLVVSKRFDELTQKYKSNHPLKYYLLNPAIRLKKFLVQSNTYNLPIHASFKCYAGWQKFYKIFQYLLYYLILALGFIGIILGFFRYGHLKNVSTMTYIIPIYICLFFPVIFGTIEWRMFNHGFVALFILATVFCGSFFKSKS